MSVTSVTLNTDEVIVCGSRVLDRGDIINLNAPKVSMVDDESYEYISELALAIDNLRYEAEQYVTERKWGLKQSEINFDDAGDPFAGVEAGDVPSVTVETKEMPKDEKRKGRKKKTEVA